MEVGKHLRSFRYLRLSILNGFFDNFRMGALQMHTASKEHFVYLPYSR